MQLRSKVKSKGLDVMLGLFRELEGPSTEHIIIEALDYKVYNSYILPIIQKLMESSKGDIMVRHAIAKNLARMARIGTRFLEVSLSSLAKRREDAIARKKAGHRSDDLDDRYLSSSMQPNFARMSMASQRREDFVMEQASQALENLDEDYVGPNYDKEV